MQSRLFEILYLLIDKKKVTARELSERFEVSQRTIYRDVDALSAAGIPVYCKKGKGGGISLLEGYVLNRTLFSEKERSEILMGLQSIAATGYGDSALLKMRSLFRQEENWVRVDFSGFGPQAEEVFDIIKECILEQCVLCFEYYSSYGQKTNREVHPLQLVFKGRAWYLYAYCLNKQAYRLFKLSRMHHPLKKDEQFERHLTEEPEISVSDEQNFTTFTMLISKELSYRAYDEFYPHQIQKNKDGSLVVSSSMPEDEWLYGYILSFGHLAKVLEPPHLRDLIAKRLKKALLQYER